ncbi:MAG: hypothetical protein ACJASM_002687 [Salibacteraceae bacterium]|jgi:hypothetical protein
MYMAALKACEQMATIVGDQQSADNYRAIWTVGVKNQNEQLWDEKLGTTKKDLNSLKLKASE